MMTDIKTYLIGDELLDDLNHYSLTLGHVLFDGEMVLGYVTTNEHTGVIEGEHLIFAQAYDHVKGLEAAWEKVMTDKAGILVPGLALPGNM